MYCTCTDHCNMLAYGKRSALHDNIKYYKDSNLGETAQSKFSKDMKNAWISFSYKSFTKYIHCSIYWIGPEEWFSRSFIAFTSTTDHLQMQLEKYHIQLKYNTCQKYLMALEKPWLIIVLLEICYQFFECNKLKSISVS